MKAVITGGAGFLGQRLARALLTEGVKGEPIDQLVLADCAAGANLGDGRAVYAVGDITDPNFIADIITEEVRVVFHLAAVVSSQAEADFDLGLNVNIDATRLLLDACRKTAACPRVVFTSSVAVFGPVGANDLIDDNTPVDPRSSYGMEKAVGELLMKEYGRRGWIDAIVLRLPTISVRPGRPNKAASSFASGVIREPLSGERAACPVPASTPLWLLSPRRAVEALRKAASLNASPLGAQRVINLPGLTVTVSEMLATLEEAGGVEARSLVYYEPDAAIERIVASWPRGWDDSRARALGFAGDADFRSLVDAFIADDLPAQRALTSKTQASM